MLEMNAQTNAMASLITTQCIEEYSPSLLLLVGTACGWNGRIKYCDVVLGDRIVDLQETEEDETEGTLFRPNHFDVTAEVNASLINFLDRERSIEPSVWANALKATYERTAFALPEGLGEPPDVRVAPILSSNRLIRAAEIQASIWRMDGRARALDMEAAGFALACSQSSGAQVRHWAVIRGISDFGTIATKPEGVRSAAALAAAMTARRLIDVDLTYVFEAPETVERQQSKVPATIRLASTTFADLAVPFFAERVGVALAGSFFDKGPRFLDVVSALASEGVDRDTALSAVTEAREQFFSDKYSESYIDDDVRSVVRQWHVDALEVFAFLDLKMAEMDVVYVGIGQGLDLSLVIPVVKSVTGVDVARKLLEVAKSQRPDLVPVHAAAEDLSGVPTNSFDLYLGLRVFQSALFDVDAALREARRVVRPNGAIVISIPDAYAADGDGGRVVLRGLATSGTDLDSDRPIRIVSYLYRALTRIGFVSLGLVRKRADLYVFGRSPD